MARKRMSNVAEMLASLLLFFLLFEICSAIAFETALLEPFHRPKIYSVAMGDANETDYRRWMTESSPWGAWHRANSFTYHIKPCFRVRYRSNEVGARDESFLAYGKNHSRDKTIVAIGDSFAEGFGVQESARFDRVLEDHGFNVLNFGSAGGFGPVQYYLVYRDLASNYEHHAVMILFLPDNDFTDNDPSEWLPAKQHRYRPYYRLQGGDYRIFYPSNAKKEDSIYRSRDNYWDYSYWTYAAGTLRIIRKIIRKRREDAFSGYRDAKESQIEAALYFLGRLVELAAPRPVVIFLIPRQNDFKAAQRSGELKVHRYFRRFKAKHRNVLVMDGLSAMKYRDGDEGGFFHSCDGHWNEVGHLAAGRALLSKMTEIVDEEARQ